MSSYVIYIISSWYSISFMFQDYENVEKLGTHRIISVTWGESLWYILMLNVWGNTYVSSWLTECEIVKVHS